MDFGPGFPGGLYVVNDTFLREEEAAVGLVDRGDLIRKSVAGEPFFYLFRRQDFVRDVVDVTRLLGVPEKEAIGRTGPDRAGGNHQFSPRGVF